MAQSILAVDADTNLLASLGYVLVREGYQFTTASDGDEALAAIERQTPDLVLLAAMLKGIDGYSVCQSLRSQKALAGLPVIFLTVRAGDLEREKALALGADDYILKPFALDDLLARIRRFLDGG